MCEGERIVFVLHTGKGGRCKRVGVLVCLHIGKEWRFVSRYGLYLPYTFVGKGGFKQISDVGSLHICREGRF